MAETHTDRNRRTCLVVLSLPHKSGNRILVSRRRSDPSNKYGNGLSKGAHGAELRANDIAARGHRISRTRTSTIPHSRPRWAKLAALQSLRWLEEFVAGNTKRPLSREEEGILRSQIARPRTDRVLYGQNDYEKNHLTRWRELVPIGLVPPAENRCVWPQFSEKADGVPLRRCSPLEKDPLNGPCKGFAIGRQLPGRDFGRKAVRPA